VREGAADRGEGLGSSGMQCEVVAVRMATGRDMMIVGRRDRRSKYEDSGWQMRESIVVIALN
jgi:hypothetical protein